MLSLIFTALITTTAILAVPVSAVYYGSFDKDGFYPLDHNHFELGDLGKYIDDSYDLEYNFFDGSVITDTVFHWGRIELDTKNNTTKLRFRGSGDESYIDDVWVYESYFTDSTVRIPNTVSYPIIKNYPVTEDSQKRLKTVTVLGINWSCEFKKFDVDPENKYMKCVDNVLFSKDGKTLMSYAQFDERTEYAVPDGTEVINDRAFLYCNNLRKITIPDTVTKIDKFAFDSMKNLTEFTLPDWVEETLSFSGCTNLEKLNISENSKLRYIRSQSFGDNDYLKEITIPSFDIKIDREAFGVTNGEQPTITIKTYEQPEVSAEGNKLTWDKIPNAEYYEVYQKLRNGEYKLLRRTKKTETVFDSLKSGYNYSFAVKAFVKITADNYDPKNDEILNDDGTTRYLYPKYFTIESTMSEDVVLTGK